MSEEIQNESAGIPETPEAAAESAVNADEQIVPVAEPFVLQPGPIVREVEPKRTAPDKGA